MENKFKIGDRVQLNSGGSIMTVNKIDRDKLGNYIVECVWQDERGNTNREQFSDRALKKSS